MATVKTALVLAGGGSLGAVQVGMLQALVEEGIRFDLVVSASVGAINGAYFAARPNAQGVAELADFWRGLRKSDVFPFSVLDTLTAILRRRGYLLRASALQNLVRRSLPVKLIEDTELPLYIVTTNLLSGAEELLSNGSAEQALLASAAIPLVFPNVRIGDKLLIDGGVASNTPIASAVSLGAKRVVVVPTGFGCACPSPPSGLVALALHTLNLMSMRQLVRDIELYASRASIHVVAPLCPLNASVFDFSQTDQLLQRAYQSTQTWIEKGGLIRTGVPDSLQAHIH
ncbi:patatin-like phospholipase family protein [Pseudomonas fluorescens]|uniref:patatin-like phospholipase family protein n=1 Tax=Pseudomonas fluorescens TaxID=294 RepID=UPI0019041E40|nr:patatin-like phospholipase family protein [Pseudomonas fluorescens]MBD8089859.1 patatin-like phospholipase family protein [Pseudomonas fluorescens]MBD8717131.1 patatin-like phospholipase family protein [Pseudomonas fluorescens]